MKTRPSPPSLTRRPWPLARAALAASAAIWAALAATQAGARSDPMKPLAPPAAATAGGEAMRTLERRAAEPAEFESDRLVAIRRNSDGRLQALIGERWVAAGERVGGRAGDATLRSLTETSATLALGRRQLVLRVLPPLLSSGDEASAAKPARGATPLAAAQRDRPTPPSRTSPRP